MEQPAEVSRYYVDVVAESMHLLHSFAAPPFRFTLTELSVLTGLSKNKTFRLLQTLVQSGVVRQEADTKRYTLGLPVLRLVSAGQAGNELLLAARDTLDWLQDTVGERVNLGARDDEDQALCIDTRESARRIQISARIGVRFPLHVGAIPKVLLAFSDDATIAGYLARNEPLRRFSPRTACTADELWAEMRAIRRTGVSVSDEDLDEGACAIAAPIYDRNGKVVAGVSIAAPVTRFGPAERNRYREVIVEAGARVSRNLGFVAVPGRWGVA
jgi:DNA-binding IclR family transcriptional regulator